MRASAHIIVLDENIVRQNVLRTEILLSEARGLQTLTVLPTRLNQQHAAISQMLEDLDKSDQTYRRLAATQYFSGSNDLSEVAAQLAGCLRPIFTPRALARSLPRQGDVLMVTRLDRLARSTRDLLNTIEAIAAKKAASSP